VDTRFPATTRKPCGLVATGIAKIDDVLGGGLPTGKLTELVSPRAGSGGQLAQTQILAATRRARQRVALIDAADAFAPDRAIPDHLRHLVWVRPTGINDALAATDVLVRDGNYGIILLDLRGSPAAELKRIPATRWHRLHRAAESSPAAILVQTTQDLVPAVTWRLSLEGAALWSDRRCPQLTLLQQLKVAIVRGPILAREELAG